MTGRYCQRLLDGEAVTFCPRGRSMEPRVKDGQSVLVTPVKLDDVKIGDVVLCRVRGRIYLHLVKALRRGQVQIGNNHGHINGWTTQVYGRLKE